MIRYFSACVTGPGHIAEGKPCQDARFIKEREGGVVVGAVADGLGSMKFSDIGSDIASREAATYCADHYSPEMTEDDVKKLMRTAFVHAYKAVLTKAVEMRKSSDLFDTTLCLAIYDGKTVWYGHAGDSGLVVRFADGHYEPVTVQQRDEDGGVYPLCCGPDYWEFGKVEGSVSVVMLMTDGVWEQVCHPYLRHEEVKVNTAFVKPFMEQIVAEAEEVAQVEQKCNDYLERCPSKYINDDKTVVVLYNLDNPAAEMPDSYYQEPDWELLDQKDKERRSAEFEQEKASNFEEDNPLLQEDEAETPETFDETEPPMPSVDEEPVSEGETSPSDKGDKQPFAEDEGKQSFVKDEDDQTREGEEDKPPAKGQKINKTGKDVKNKVAAVCAVPSSKDGRKGALKKTMNLMTFFIVIAFSLLSFVLQDVIREHAGVSYFAVLLVCFFANATILLPAPSMLIVAQFALLLNPLATAVCGALGAALGEMTGYFAGGHLGRLLPPKVPPRLALLIRKRPLLTVFCFSVIPLPLFDVIGLISGMAKLNPIRFLTACLVGKMVKMASFAYLARYIVTLIG